MKGILLVAAAALALAASGCTRIDSDPLTRVTPFVISDEAVAQSPYRVADINVTVPRSLTVSEANSYFPRADIVWRGDPFGDRHAQVEAILNEGLNRGAASLRGPRPVVVDVTLSRFHALTERSRYTFGGVFAIKFAMTVRDASTGAVIQPTRTINAEFDAAGGAAAVAEEQQGISQKSRVLERLAQVIQYELATPRAQ